MGQKWKEFTCQVPAEPHEWGHAADLLVVSDVFVWLHVRTSWEELYKNEYTSYWDNGMSICKSKLNGTSGDIKKQLKMGQKLKYKLKL